MTRYLRWGYLLPRLVVLLALLVGSEYGAGWLLKRGIRTAGQSAVGARVDIARSEASLLRARLRLGGVQVADPDKPLTNLFEADAVELDFDAASLLRKQAVVKQGRVRGLRLGTPRTTSGRLPDSPPAAEPHALSRVTDAATAAAAEQARRWLAGLGEQFEADFAQRLESVRVARSLREKWPGRYDALAASADQIKTDAQQLQRGVAAARQNPLRHAAFLQSVPTRVGALRERLAGLRGELQALPGQIQADKQAIDAARRHDEELIRQQLAVAPIDASSLTAYLLGEEVAGPMAELIDWLRWVRRMAPAGSGGAAPQRSRGVDVLFAGLERRPDVLVERLTISGAARIGGRPVELAGTLTDFTTQPTLHGQPATLSLTASGAVPLKLRAILDRTGPTPRDELLADCDGLSLPALRLGAGGLAMAVDGGPASLSVSLLLEGDTLSGDVQLIQQQLAVTPQRGPASSPASGINASLRDAVARQLDQMPSLVTRLSVGGTLEQPSWALWSNLGPAVSQAVETAVADIAEAQAGRLLTATQAEVDEQLARFDEEIAAVAARVTPLVNGPSGAIEQLAAGLGAGASPLGRLGRSLPAAAQLLK